jgi:hypothetical protein
MMKIEIRETDYPLLCKMVERGWADGDLAEYLTGDQIEACERILKKLGIGANSVMHRDTDVDPHPNVKR